MVAFEVKDMTCGHCVSTITKAVKFLDGDAQVAIDLASKRVQIESRAADEAELKTAIEEAGYTPTPVAEVAAEPPQKAAGSCCGCSR